MASCSEVAPNGTTVSIESGSAFKPVVNGTTLVEMRVEGEDRRLVARRVHPAEDMGGRFARVRQECPSMLPLTSNSTATLTPAMSVRKSAIAPGLPAVEHLEVVRLEIPDEPSLLVADDGRDPDEVDARFEGVRPGAAVP